LSFFKSAEQRSSIGIFGQNSNVECLYKECAHAQSKFKLRKKKLVMKERRINIACRMYMKARAMLRQLRQSSRLSLLTSSLV
jgi:hypothetical protein